jgi:hypothetical protein
MPSSSSKPIGNGCSTLRTRGTARVAALAPVAPILVDAPAAAAALRISERAFHGLRKRSDFPRDATVVFGPHCVRFRLEALHAFALLLASTAQIESGQPVGRASPREQAGTAEGEARRGALMDSGGQGDRSGS